MNPTDLVDAAFDRADRQNRMEELLEKLSRLNVRLIASDDTGETYHIARGHWGDSPALTDLIYEAGDLND